jgi:immunity protein, SdpI family
MEGNRSAHARAIVVLALGYLVGAAAFGRLPGPFLEEKLAARILVAFTLPTTALAIYVLFHSLWTHDRVRSSNGAFEATYFAIVLWALVFVVALHSLVMAVLTTAIEPMGRVSASRVVVVLLGALLIAIGNLLPRTRPNVALGVRTRRTLASAPLWQRVHRVGGYATVALGAVMACTGLVIGKQAMGAIISAAALAAAVAVAVSYHRYARA